MIGKIEVSQEMKELVAQYKELNRNQGYDQRKKEWKVAEAKKEAIQAQLNSQVKAQAVAQLQSVGLDFSNEGRYFDESNKFILYVKIYGGIWENSSEEYKPSYYIATNLSERGNYSIVGNDKTAEEVKAAIEVAKAKQIARNNENAMDNLNKAKVCGELGIKVGNYGYFNCPEYQLKNQKERNWYGRDAKVEVGFSSKKVRVQLEANMETEDAEEAIKMVKEFQAFIASRYELKVRE